MMADMDLAVERLNELKALGIKLAMDDFGTGYSSLAYLSKLPVDILKMDRSFLTSSEAISPLPQAIVRIGETLNLEVVAEGIEQATQASLLGDGIFLVAMAWQVYAVWDAPAALSMVGIAMTVPTIVCLLPGGVVSDRLSRRAVMLAADALRAVAIAVLALLSLTGRIQVWEIAALAMVYGAGTAFFTPAFEALVPDILPESDLPAANSLDQFVRPIALRLAGPALGGWLIAAFGPGIAFA